MREPPPGLWKILQAVTAQQRAVQAYLNAVASQQRQVAALTQQVNQVADAARRISEVPKSISNAAEAISALQRQPGLKAAKAISAAGEALAAVQVWRQHHEQMLQTVRLLQERPSFRMGFSAPTLDRAAEVLEELRSIPPEHLPERLPADTDAVIPELSEAALQEAIDAVEPTTSTMDPATARSWLVAIVATLVFLKVIQWSLEHPEVANTVLTVGTLAWWSATLAGKQAGKLWDKAFGARPDGPGSQHDPNRSADD
jgi:hypothetical protein